ncbi:MAG: diaminopimelate epimerase [Bacteroidales bacterium]|uniref:diaminopimelate epimerase n=1 Tax=Candidatus Cryptobacteroides sp. TaxID=2952915 RepID=UPI002A7491A1|nr:diaminopimelate epimerase [Candidatus Cryptobacteroides sp.]MDD7233977.1 diaminopimelate epimerase [Bacteroidales bacterium]MDY2702266.1 diaminopimelate epimerase [Candidatus Cryptobacteroides sp.]
MLQRFSKYHGAGNDFLIADNRDGHLSLSEEVIRHLCDRHTGFGADGVMLLESGSGKDFNMVYFNPDGSGGMMCGNGGRCIVAFAADCGAVSPDSTIVFDAADGEHIASIPVNGMKGEKTVRLKMKDVSGITAYPEEDGFFLDTGTRHYVKFVSGLADYPVLSEGPVLRHDSRFAPVGTNVNFVEVAGGPASTVRTICTAKGDSSTLEAEGPASTVLSIRTFEKGVEYETLACGTGIVASAMASFVRGVPPSRTAGETVAYSVRAAIADLSVEFVPHRNNGLFCASDVYLTGPACFVGYVEVQID